MAVLCGSLMYFIEGGRFVVTHDYPEGAWHTTHRYSDIAILEQVGYTALREIVVWLMYFIEGGRFVVQPRLP
jgi:hypothetical protein